MPAGRHRWKWYRREFDAVVLAVPAYVASRLLCDDQLRDDQQLLADELSRIEYASTAVIASGHSWQTFGIR